MLTPDELALFSFLELAQLNYAVFYLLETNKEKIKENEELYKILLLQEKECHKQLRNFLWEIITENKSPLFYDHFINYMCDFMPETNGSSCEYRGNFNFCMIEKDKEDECECCKYEDMYESIPIEKRIEY